MIHSGALCTCLSHCFMLSCILPYSDDQIGQTPLCVAAYHGHEAMVEFLIQSGADIDGKFAFSKSNDNAVNWKVHTYINTP